MNQIGINTDFMQAEDFNALQISYIKKVRYFLDEIEESANLNERHDYSVELLADITAKMFHTAEILNVLRSEVE